MTNTTIPLTPWTAGIADLHHATRLPKGAVMDAVNGVFGPAGEFSSRDGYTHLSNGANSLFEHGGKNYGVMNSTLGEFRAADFLGLFGPVSRVSWGVLNNEPVFTAYGLLGKISGGAATLIGTELPGAFAAYAGAGALPAGVYHVALSCVSSTGEESGLSDTQRIELTAAGGVSLTVPQPLESATVSIRIYCTKTDGDVLHEYVTVPAGTTQYTVAALPTGEPAHTQFLKRMPGGDYVRYWQGRLLVARHKTLYLSEALRYGAYDPRIGHISFPERITFIEALESGIYVGQETCVLWLNGTAPAELSVNKVGLLAPQTGGSVVIPESALNEDLRQRVVGKAVVWLTSAGFALGTGQGSVIYPQADLLGSTPVSQGSIIFNGTTLTALSQ